MMPYYTTCPPSSAFAGRDYLSRVAQVASWSEKNGAEGMLIYTDNSLVDPWCIAQAALDSTEHLLPLVAVQPIYIPPFTLAKRIASLAHLYGRAVALNLVAGGFVKDLAALGDVTPHDERYERLHEYASLIKALLRNETVTFEGRHYTLAGAQLSPSMPEGMFPEIFVSGSSAAGMGAAASLEAIPVNYPPSPEDLGSTVGAGSFARVGIIARDSEAEAWAVAHERFPPDRRGEILHAMATATSDSVWHKTLAGIAEAGGESSPYWLHPLKTYRTFCPYLVGSHTHVGAVLGRYLDLGFAGFILDVPQTEEDLPNTNEAFRYTSCQREEA